jgi:fumarate reductase flavoprotein subunit
VHATDIDVLTSALVTSLRFSPDGRVHAADISRPDGATQRINASTIVLACNGYGGNAALVKQHIPEIADGLYYGHAGNTGDAVQWGEQLNAQLRHLSGYQGHGSLAHPHGILVTWALMMQGGFQVNLLGQRFSNEHLGYSEQAVHVLAQPQKLAWNIYDDRIHRFAQSFPDYCDAIKAGAIKSANSVDELAELTGLPTNELTQTLAQVEALHRSGQADSFGRRFDEFAPLKAPLYAVKVTGALFHTQGGLMINQSAQVLGKDGEPFANLFAGGGAACGVSGPDVSGYLSGNGLLTAIGFGFIAGHEAALRANPNN